MVPSDALPGSSDVSIHRVLCGGWLGGSALQLRHLQPQQPLTLQNHIQPRPQRRERLPQRGQLAAQNRILGIPRLDNGPQPGNQLTRLPGTGRQTKHIGHSRRSCSTSAKGSSITRSVSRTAHATVTP